MALVDDRGRILGRFNLVDLLLIVILIGLIPLGYGAYALFRNPLPQLSGIEPAVVQLDQEMRVRIRGTNLRPYMRISFDNNQTRQFLFKDSTTAEVVFGDIPPGEYDVVLYDFAQERSRLPKGLKITPPALPITAVHVAGFLTGVTDRLRAVLKPGLSYPGVAEILAMGPSSPDMARIAAGARTIEIPVEKTVKISALLRVPCTVQQNAVGVAECRAGSANGPGVFLGPPVGPGVYLMFPVLDVNLPFLITQVRPPIDPTTIDVEVKVLPLEDAAELARVGDSDIGSHENEFAAGAVVKQAMYAGRHLMFSVPAFPTLTGWDYAGQTLRVGGGFFFVSPRYQLTGTVTNLPSPPKSKP